jgi:hypothetical protein
MARSLSRVTRPGEAARRVAPLRLDPTLSCRAGKRAFDGDV